LGVAQPQQPVSKLNIVIIEGEGAINNIRQRTAREPIVQVEDENHKPIAGAAVLFTLPRGGATGVFPGGDKTLSVVTDQNGRAVAKGFQPNNVAGKYQIQVQASYNNLTSTAAITQSNMAMAVAAAAGGISAKVLIILAIVGGAVAGGVIAATHGGGSSSNSGGAGAPSPTVITPGAPSVGTP